MSWQIYEKITHLRKVSDLQNNYDRFIYDLTNALQETL